ncbi:LOW QUALITY PROTEIN: cytoplasmic protein NCK2-like [Haliotis rubra]|uniref:LOW QUALITY PROTEIN: cytoplasmic protein NCK2-like n=1 Tax=Haliotis rubra TaxID=36100 RepID=UPI001EE50559|nr:LOW QUALITY PROTEIN: cytoplasmic protein NCK2-like [Haliotis rubra]
MMDVKCLCLYFRRKDEDPSRGCFKMAEEVTVTAKYDYHAENSQELDIKKNEKLTLLDDSKDWWKVQNSSNKSGFVPSNYVRRIKPKASIFSSLKSLGRKKSDAAKNSACPSPATLRNGDARSNGSPSPSGSSTSSQPCHEATPATAKYHYTSQREDEISLVKGEHLIVLEKSNDGWWKGQKNDNSVGWFPSNYVLVDSEVDYCTAATAESMMNDCIEVVTTLYPFTGKNKEEMSFDKGQRLEIIDKPSEDPEWWFARNSRGDMGLIPRNYVQSVEECDGDRGTSMSSCTPQSQSTSSLSNASSLGISGGRRQFHVSGPLQDKDWYFGKINRPQCEELLSKYAEDGDFLIRDSESAAGQYTVVLKAPNRNKHFRVHVKDGEYQIGQQTFTSLEQLIDHYKRHPIYKQESEKLYLVKPFVMQADF